MPRKPRIVLPGQPQHVIIRGVNQEPILHDEADYRYYLGRLNSTLGKHHSTLHAYVLMTNHFHLLISPADETGVARTMESVGRYYVQYFSTTYGRTGTLWEGRYKVSLVDTEQYLLTCYRYIELNPVRAQMVDHPAEYPWSSYRRNTLRQTNPLITTHEQYRTLGTKAENQQADYRGLFLAHISEQHLVENREVANKKWVLGKSYFKDKIAKQL